MFRPRTALVLVGLMLGLMLPAARAGAARAEQGNLPAGWRRQVWQGVVLSYDPKSYRFEITKPSNAKARAAARLAENPAACPSDGVDCIPGEVTLQLYPHRGGDARDWVTRNGPELFPGFAEAFTDTIIGGRQAIQYVMDIGVGGALTAYAVPTGADILVIITQAADARLLSLLQFTQADTTQLVGGQVAMTKLGRAWDLWTARTGGARVYERPKLMGGTFLTILALHPQAVQVRTSDDVTGWIRAAAATALTTKPALLDEDARFLANGAQVVATNGLMFRTAPRSTAPKVITVPKAVDKLPVDQRLIVLGRRGDWLRVIVNESDVNGFGWVRWQYDGARYVAVARQ